LYCWGGSSFSKRARQKRQKLFIGGAVLFEPELQGETFFSLGFYPFWGRLSTAAGVSNEGSQALR
jgi:hypothetical protein